MDLCSGRDAHHDEGDTVRGEGRRKGGRKGEGGKEEGEEGRGGEGDRKWVRQYCNYS